MPSDRADVTEGRHDQTRSSDESTRRTGRRNFLKIGATAAAAATTVGAFGTASAASAVNIVDEGADSSGGEAIDDVLESAASSGATIEFPSGTYLVSGGVSLSYDDLTLRGTDATLVLPDGGIDISGDGWVFEGFEIDFRQQDGFSPTNLSGDGWEFKRVVYRGTQMQSKSTCLVPSVPSGGSALMEDVYIHEGCADPQENSHAKAMWTNDMSGTLTIRRMWAEHWAENTLYLSDSDGRFVVEDSYFRNTNVAGPRFGRQGTARGCVFLKDEVPPYQANEERSGAVKMRGVWCNAEKTGGNGDWDVVDCDFHYTSQEGAGPGVEADGGGDQLTVENCRFHSSFSWTAVDDAGVGSVELRSNEVSGGASLQNAQTADSQVTDPSPPMPQPPEVGSAPGSGGGTSTGGGTGGTANSSTNETDATNETDEAADSTDEPLPNELVIDGTGDEDAVADYEFTVSGEAEHWTQDGSTVDPESQIDGSTVSGQVSFWKDAYRFSGEVTDFTLDGSATVRLDGEEVSPDSLGTSDGGNTGGDGGDAPPTLAAQFRDLPLFQLQFW